MKHDAWRIVHPLRRGVRNMQSQVLATMHGFREDIYVWRGVGQVPWPCIEILPPTAADGVHAPLPREGEPQHAGARGVADRVRRRWKQLNAGPGKVHLHRAAFRLKFLDRLERRIKLL